MLPSTGLFKATNCSFYDSGLCERPYCHFRHVKKDCSSSLEADEEVLEQLVSDAVQKVLQNSELPSSSFSEQHPHENFKSDLAEDDLLITEDKECTLVKPTIPATVPSYKPTPIAELNKKRHIPVPYSPRNCSTVQPKRQISSDDLCAPPQKKIKLLPDAIVTPLSEYNPDVDTNKCVGYSPSLPKNQTKEKSNHSYIPSAIANLISPVTDYIPTGNNGKNVCYEPSVKKIQEPEYKPHFDSGFALSPSNYTPTDKAVLDELNLDEFSTELELLDEILHEHTASVSNVNSEEHKEESITANLESNKQIIDNGTSSRNLTTELCLLSPNNILTLNNVNVPNETEINTDICKRDDTIKKKKREHRSKSSRHSSSRSESSHKTKSSSSSKNKETTDKQAKSQTEKLETSKEYKSSKSSSKTKKSKSSSTSKDHKSSSHSQETRNSSLSSSRNRKHSKHSKRKRSPSNETEAPLNSDPISDPDESDIEEECFKIFQEYAPDETVTKDHYIPSEKLPEIEEIQEKHVSKKLRVAHDGSAESLSKLVAPSRRPVINPALAMGKRLQDLRESYQLKASEKEARTTLLMRRVEQGGLLTNHKNPSLNTGSKDLTRLLSTSCTSTVTKTSAVLATPSKLRIAHVPNVPNLLEEKTRVQRSKQVLHQRLLLKNRIQSGVVHQTTAQSAPKGAPRSAHVPSLTQLQKAMIVPETGSKIPAVIRQRHLDILVKEHENFMSREEAQTKAMEAEKMAYNKSNNKTIYVSSVTGAIMRLRKEKGRCAPPSTSGVLHHSAILGTNNSKKWSVLKPRKAAPVSLYEHLLRYKLTEEKLVANGFPRRHPVTKGKAISSSKYEKNLPWEGSGRICSRCNKQYEINSQGFQTTSDACMHHWGKFWKNAYGCCGGDSLSTPCSVAPCHITSNFKMNDTGFVETLPPNTEPSDGDYEIYALDCEMVHTTKGVELARVTVIDRNRKVIYDTLVKPSNPILDYSTRFSGITEDLLENVTTSIIMVQATLLSIFNSKSILIGHSLDSDLRALKLIHDYVVDTSLVFPHERNSEYKSSLRHLALKHLNRLIQESVDGHSSAEDAIAAMDLMLYRVKEDLKTA